MLIKTGSKFGRITRSSEYLLKTINQSDLGIEWFIGENILINWHQSLWWLFCLSPSPWAGRCWRCGLWAILSPGHNHLSGSEQLQLWSCFPLSCRSRVPAPGWRRPHTAACCGCGYRRRTCAAAWLGSNASIDEAREQQFGSWAVGLARLVQQKARLMSSNQAHEQ